MGVSGTFKWILEGFLKGTYKGSIKGLRSRNSDKPEGFRVSVKIKGYLILGSL